MDDRLAYLLDAKAKVDAAMAVSLAGKQPQAQIDMVVYEACRLACEALTRLNNDDDFWNGQKRHKQSAVSAAIGFFKRFSPSSERIHFDERCLPITAKALVKWGYKPPREAQLIVSEAKQACMELQGRSCDIEFLVTDAKTKLEKLTDAACKLSGDFRKQEVRKEWRDRAVKVLGWVTKTLAAALITVIMSNELKINDHALSEVGKCAIYLVSIQGMRLFSQGLTGI